MSKMPKRHDDDAALDAIELLTNDHQEVDGLFEHYDDLVKAGADDATKKSAAEQICTMLIVHARIEEELFYPAARAAIGKTELLDEAEVEHLSVKELIAKIQGSGPGDALYDAQVHVLGEYVRHHVDEEENELFPRLEESDLDLDALGASMASRQEELLSVQPEVERA